MHRLLFIIIVMFITLTQCKKKEIRYNSEKEISLNTYTNALDVPLKRTGVIINVDSITFFDSKKIQTDTSKYSIKILNSISSLNKKIDYESEIKKKVEYILTRRKIKFTMLEEINTKQIPLELITKENVNKVNFEVIKEKYNYDDLLIISIKNGFDYNKEINVKETQFVAKTFLTINILDLTKNELKFSENIGGISFLDDSINSITNKDLEEIMNKSIKETIEIIEKKY